MWCSDAQSRLTFCNPMNCSSPGSSVHGISQAGILVWVAISFSRGSSQPRDWTVSHVSCIGRQILYHWATQEAFINQFCYMWCLDMSFFGLVFLPLMGHIFPFLCVPSNFLMDARHCDGEGNGNPLQCSCLENPRDGGTWWAAVYGVTQSRTQLKRLSSSSSSRHCEFYIIRW